MERLPNIHPGEVLLEEFLEPLGISQSQAARDLRVPPRRIYEIVRRKRAITADTALRLARYFGMSAEFWLGLQVNYDLEEAQLALDGRLESEVVQLDLSTTREGEAALPAHEGRGRRTTMSSIRTG